MIDMERMALMITKISLLKFMFLLNIVAYGQTKNTFVMKNNSLFNEFWSWSKGPLFKNYYFADDGSFIHSNGYSGGIWSINSSEGTYTYDPSIKEIRLHVKKKYSSGITVIKEETPTKLVLKDLNDTSVTVSFGKASLNVIEMGRTVGLTTDQYWYKDPNSSHDLIQFTSFGQATIVQETDIRRTYICSYHIHGNLLLLDIRSITTEEDAKGKQTKIFTPATKTFLKVHIDKDLVRVEKADLNKIIDGTRNWEFRNQEFHITHMALTENATEWEEFNRVVKP
ncbi:hypothetical protein D3C87_219290 [compost metagenome]